MQGLNWERVGRIHGKNTYFTGGMQVRGPVAGQKYQCPRNNKILDGYENFSTYVIVGSLKAATNFGC